MEIAYGQIVSKSLSAKGREEYDRIFGKEETVGEFIEKQDNFFLPLDHEQVK